MTGGWAGKGSEGGVAEAEAGAGKISLEVAEIRRKGLAKAREWWRYRRGGWRRLIRSAGGVKWRMWYWAWAWRHIADEVGG